VCPLSIKQKDEGFGGYINILSLLIIKPRFLGRQSRSLVTTSPMISRLRTYGNCTFGMEWKLHFVSVYNFCSTPFRQNKLFSSYALNTWRLLGGLPVNYPLPSPILTKTAMWQENFAELPNVKFHENSLRECGVADRRTDCQTLQYYYMNLWNFSLRTHNKVDFFFLKNTQMRSVSRMEFQTTKTSAGYSQRSWSPQWVSNRQKVET